MSLIQEALQRRNTELGHLKLAPPGSSAPPPLPEPPPPPPAEPERKPARGKIIFLAMLLLVLLGYGGWWFLLRPPAKQAASSTKPPPATNQSAKATLAQPPTNIIARAKAKLETTLSPERVELVMGGTNPAAARTAIPAPAPTIPTQVPAPNITTAPQQTALTNTPAVTHEPPAVTKAVPPPAPMPKPPPEPVRWPKLNITGIMGRSGGDSVAFINGQILKVGDSIAEARILAIAESGVQVVFQGETNTIRVGKGSE